MEITDANEGALSDYYVTKAVSSVPTSSILDSIYFNDSKKYLIEINVLEIYE